VLQYIEARPVDIKEDIFRLFAGWAYPFAEAGSVFQLPRKDVISITMPHALRSTTQASGHDLSDLPEMSVANRGLRSRAENAPQRNPSLRRRPARSCSQKPGFGLLGRNAAERAKNLPLINTGSTDLNEPAEEPSLTAGARRRGEEPSTKRN
jgi:hypothetical protein